MAKSPHLLASLLWLAIGAGVAFAAPGDLDPSFGTGGIVLTPGDNLQQVALQPDGKILAVGNRWDVWSVGMIARYEADGSLDTGFGTGGILVVAPIGGQTFHFGSAVAVQPDGAILVGGTGFTFVDPNIVYFGFVTRLLADGSADPSFGTGGTVVVETQIQDLRVLGDGHIVAAGSGGGSQIQVCRLASDGSLDGTFGTGGYANVATIGSSSAAALAIDADDRILVAGYARDGGPIMGNCNDHDMALVRFTTGGLPDPTFGTGGIRTTPAGTNTCDEAEALTLAPDGHILVAGFSQASSGPSLKPASFVLARYDSTGSLDPAFGGDGLVTTRIGTVSALGHALALQPNGQAIVAGQAFTTVVHNEADFDFALVRYRPNGRLDPVFGSGGVVLTPSGPASPAGPDSVRSLALQPDGRLVAGGVRKAATGQVWTLARYLVAECGPGASGTCRPVVDGCDVAESCDGVGLYCPPDGFAGDGTACDDGDTCTSGATCGGGVCGTPVADGTACSDGTACTAGAETCTEGVCVSGPPLACAPCEACDAALGCVGAPAPSCSHSTAAGRSLLTIKRDFDPSKARIGWSWAKGEATALGAFGAPEASDAYQVCMFDESGVTPSVLFRATIPAGGQCDGKPCWRPTTKGFRFRSRSGSSAGGVTQLQLQSGAEGKARVALKGAGTALALPTLPLATPIRVELRAGTGACFATTHTAAGLVRNDAQQLKSKGD